MGQVRFNLLKTGTFEIHIVLSAAKRGRGFGKETLLRAIRYASLRLAAKRILAHIRKDNAPSLAVFQTCGFRYLSTVRMHGIPARRYEIKLPPARSHRL